MQPQTLLLCMRFWHHMSTHYIWSHPSHVHPSYKTLQVSHTSAVRSTCEFELRSNICVHTSWSFYFGGGPGHLDTTSIAPTVPWLAITAPPLSLWCHSCQWGNVHTSLVVLTILQVLRNWLTTETRMDRSQRFVPNVWLYGSVSCPHGHWSRFLHHKQTYDMH